VPVPHPVCAGRINAVQRLLTANTVLIALAASFAAPADTDAGPCTRRKTGAGTVLASAAARVLADLNLNHFVAPKHVAVSLVDVTV
jgi:hypothetical protein